MIDNNSLDTELENIIKNIDLSKNLLITKEQFRIILSNKDEFSRKMSLSEFFQQIIVLDNVTKINGFKLLGLISSSEYFQYKIFENEDYINAMVEALLHADKRVSIAILIRNLCDKSANICDYLISNKFLDIVLEMPTSVDLIETVIKILDNTSLDISSYYQVLINIYKQYTAANLGDNRRYKYKNLILLSRLVKSNPDILNDISYTPSINVTDSDDNFDSIHGNMHILYFLDDIPLTYMDDIIMIFNKYLVYCTIRDRRQKDVLNLFTLLLRVLNKNSKNWYGYKLDEISNYIFTMLNMDSISYSIKKLALSTIISYYDFQNWDILFFSSILYYLEDEELVSIILPFIQRIIMTNAEAKDIVKNFEHVFEELSNNSDLQISQASVFILDKL